MNFAKGSRAQPAVFAPNRLLKPALEILANIVLPVVIYGLTSARLGDARALMAATAPPILWSVIEFIRMRRIDAISLLALGGIALSLLAFASGGGVQVLQLRENLVAGLVGLVFLGSAAIGRPLIQGLALAGARRRAAPSAEAFDALKDHPDFRRAMMAATLVWGLGLTGLCAFSCVLVFAISIKLYLLISAPISYAILGLLTAWTFWFVRRAKSRAEARAA